MKETDPRTPTQYRIVPLMFFGTIDYYLQFLHIENVERKKFILFGKKEWHEDRTWRCIYSDRKAIHGYGLYPDDCPTLSSKSEGPYDFVSGYDCEIPKLEAFGKRWPHIEDYFAHMQKEYRDWKNRKKREVENAKTVYLPVPDSEGFKH